MVEKVPHDRDLVRGACSACGDNKVNIIRSTRDLQTAQYWELAKLIRSIRKEVERRNPIGVNMYTDYIECAANALDEISGGEIGNFTSECGPRERKCKA